MPADDLEAFANYFEVGCTEEEIVIRFGVHYDNQQAPQLRWTVITTAGYARELIRLLEDTLLQQSELAEQKRSGGSSSDPSNAPQ